MGEVWQKTNEKIISAISAAVATALLILIGLNPFYRPSTDEIIKALGREYHLDRLDNFIFLYLGRPNQKPLSREASPELSQFEYIASSLDALLIDLNALKDKDDPASCKYPLTPFEGWPKEPLPLLTNTAYVKVVDIQAHLRESGLINKRKDDLSLFDIWEITHIFEGGMGREILHLISLKTAAPQNWTCSTLGEILSMAKQWNDYNNYGRRQQYPEAIGRLVAKADESHNFWMEMIPQDDAILQDIAAKKLTDFYDAKAKQTLDLKEKLEVYAGGKGPLKEILPPMPFFWLVAIFRL